MIETTKHSWLDREKRCSCGWSCAEKGPLDVSTQWSLHKSEEHFREKGYGHAATYFDDKVLQAYRECADVLHHFTEKLKTI